MKLEDLRELGRSMGSKGLAPTLRLLIASLLYRLHTGLFLRFRDICMARETRKFDRLHGTKTDRGQVLDAGAESVREGTGYHPSAAPEFHEMLARLPIRHQEYTFLDIGSGVGKTLLMASEFPFRRIVGVESGAGLSTVAKDNIRAFCSSTQRCANVSATHADALEYPLPAEPSVLFFFNPFGAELMARMADRIQRSLRSSPRPLYVVYYNPQHPARVDDTTYFERIASGLGLQGRYVIYRARSEAVLAFGVSLSAAPPPPVLAA